MRLLFFIRRMMSVVYLMKHPAVPKRLKVLPILAVAYFLLPRDLLMDFRPFGHLDDLIVITVLLNIFAAKAAPYVNPRRKEKPEAIPVDFEVKERVGADGDSASARSEGGEPPSDAPPETDLRYVEP